MKKKPKTSAASELMQVYNEAMESFIVGKGDIKRIKSLRPSQLPFCPVGFFVYHAAHGALRSMDMRGAFYTEVGTAVHEVLQRYMGRSGRFLANWQCVICRKKHLVSMENVCCDFPMKYSEVEISYKGVVGHIDAVFRDRKGNYWIVDFKTTSIKSIEEKLRDPGRVYREQVEAYALMLWLEHGIKVKGVMLMFVKRDNPKEPGIWELKLGDLDFKAIKSRMVRYKRWHSEVLAVKTMKAALALAAYGRCNNKWCKSCSSVVSQKQQIKHAYARAVAVNRLPLKSLQ